MPPGRSGQRPDDADNPLGAWYVRTEIHGAAEGPLAGKTVAVKDNTAVALSTLAYDPWDPTPAGPHLGIINFPDQTSRAYPNIVGDSDPDYSPTGSKLAFSHWSRIYTSDADGTHRKDVTSGYYPDWQPVFG